jgi:hypothetical protein
MASPMSGAMGQDANVAGDLDGLSRADRVRDDEFAQLRIGDPGHRATGQDAMRDVGEHVFGALGEKGFAGVAERAAGIDDVVDQNAGQAGDVADDVHDLGFARALAALVDDREGRVDALRERAARTTPPTSATPPPWASGSSAP